MNLSLCLQHEGDGGYERKAVTMALDGHEVPSSSTAALFTSRTCCYHCVGSKPGGDALLTNILVTAKNRISFIQPVQV
jgi:hypothetical protein